MSPLPHATLAEKYLVDDLPGAATGGARLNGILRKLEAGEKPTTLGQSYLGDNGLHALLALARAEVDFGRFYMQASQEQSERILQGKAKAAEQLAEQIRQAEAKKAAAAEFFTAQRNDPAYRRRQESRALRDRFDIGFVEPENYRAVMRVLKQIDAGKRISPADAAWISTQGPDCWTDKLAQAWHRIEAAALTDEWENTGNVWAAVNASGHWRKGGNPEAALDVTERALGKTGPNPKVRSALKTTRGGAYRDFGRLADAQALGLEAHELTPSDFRPCTLLGAVFLELGDHAAGLDWYGKAETRGAKRRAIDQDLRGILARSAPDAREGILAFLLSQDAVRFASLQCYRVKECRD